MTKRVVAAVKTVALTIRDEVKPYIPTKPATTIRLVKGYQSLTTITDDAQLTKATEAMKWLKAQIAGVKTNKRLQDLITKTKAAYDAAKSIERDALSLYVPLEKEIREEMARYQTARERARIAASSKLTTKLTKQLTAAAAPVEVEVGGDTFVFEPEADVVGTAVTLQAPDTGAGMRKYFHVALVDPKKPRDKNGDPIVNDEAGLEALVAAIAAKQIPAKWLTLNEDFAQEMVDAHELALDVPGVVPYFTMRPVIGGRP